MHTHTQRTLNELKVINNLNETEDQPFIQTLWLQKDKIFD